MLVDLHLHTTCSDGVFTPERLFEEIRARKLEAFSITDHDTLGAYPIPADLCERSISGLEVDSQLDGHTVHILAYGIDDNASPLMLALSEQRQARFSRMESMVDRLGALGIRVDFSDVVAQAAGGSIGRPHLARTLVDKGYAGSVQEAFNLYIADDGDGYVALKRQSSAEIIDLIHHSGGVAIVAHPKRLRAAHHLAHICDLGADGIEVVHPTSEEETQREMLEFARDRSLLVTGGTDFHQPSGRPIGVDFDAAFVEAVRETIRVRCARRLNPDSTLHYARKNQYTGGPLQILPRIPS